MEPTVITITSTDEEPTKVEVSNAISKSHAIYLLSIAISELALPEQREDVQTEVN